MRKAGIRYGKRKRFGVAGKLSAVEAVYETRREGISAADPVNYIFYFIWHIIAASAQRRQRDKIARCAVYHRPPIIVRG